MAGQVGIGTVERNAAALRGMALFTEMSLEDLRLLAEQARSCRYAPGTVLDDDWIDAAMAGIIARGSIQLLHLAACGRSVTLMACASGEVVLPDDVAGAPVSYAVAASPETHVLYLPQAALFAVLARYPDGVPALLRAQSRRARHVAQRLVGATFDPVRVRLARELAARASADDGHLVRATHDELAAQIGVTREQVSKGGRQLLTAGLISVPCRRHAIHVPDPARLAGCGDEHGDVSCDTDKQRAVG